ncbi:Alpha/Beta hydrolase protein [Staphylotrichum tortipilum]|uniref:Carboxylic ester hydrolase n=1 Tax=Staphylotrichum tortipilum TaxID=2831512 RepID=A0AAN6RW26_9PEZI|nr:Alpha/Beta hydrolase protein [Staphylotrichum longicolle]
MCCPPSLKRRARRRAALPSTWISAAALLLLFWLYLYGIRYGSGRAEVKGPLLGTGSGGKSPSSSSSSSSSLTDKTHTSPNMAPPPKQPNPNGPAVVLPQGTYIGTTLGASSIFPKAVEAFRGVPYAQDTSGENRFRPPQPLPESTQTFDAESWGMICPADGVVRSNMSENCLNANIYRPANLVDRDGFTKPTKGQKPVKDAPKKRPALPVVVYIHGGGFNTGHGTERNMATFSAWADAPMVAVNFNYRVGALGFLPSDVTARQGLLNLGLRDQQMLLQWVQDNIAAFGGDPDNVTVMGLSAGAHSVGHHIMYYSRAPAGTKVPFAKAILESGAATARAVFYPTHPRHLVQFREFLVAAGAAGVAEEDIFPHLRTLPLATIVEASKAVWDKYVDSVTWPFQPVIDGPNRVAYSSLANAERPPLIPDLPITSWLAGNHLRIPIITGFNTNEGTVFVPSRANTAADFRAFFQTLIPSLTADDLDALEALYPDPVTIPTSPYKKVPRGMGKQWARLDAAYSHYAYICPVLQTAHYMSGATGGNVYVYHYAATAAFGTANHGDEAPVVSHDLDEFKEMQGLAEVARAMHGKWAAFGLSKDGRPDKGDGKGTVADWPVFESPFGRDGEGEGKGEGLVMVFGEGNDERAGGSEKGEPAKVVGLTEVERATCRFWWERVWLSEGLGGRGEGKKWGGAKLG